MKIKVTHADEGWQPSPDSDKLYTIHIEGHAEPQKTWDKDLAVVGEHEAELKSSKSGKAYWSKPKSFNKSYPNKAKEFKADPQKLKQEFSLEVARNQSIQKQVALKGAVDLIVAGKRDYAELQVTFDDLLNLLNPRLVNGPTSHDDEVEAAGDFAKINPDDDLVPISFYEELGKQDVV